MEQAQIFSWSQDYYRKWAIDWKGLASKSGTGPNAARPGNNRALLVGQLP
jgi:hypothetical protein